MSTFRVSETADIYKIDHVFKDLQKESAYRLAGKLKEIMAIFMGNSESTGLISMLTQEAYSEQPKEWIDKMEKVVSYIGPNSKFVKTLINNKHLRLSIDKSNLPPHISPENLQEFDNVLGMRNSYEGVSIPALQWYFLMLIWKLHHSQTPTRKNLTHEDCLNQDDFFFALTRNPLLVLIRKNLQQFSSIPEESSKLVQTIRSYLVDAVVWKYRQHNSIIQRNILQNRSKNYRFELKPNDILALFLALHYKRQSFADMEVYFQSVVDSYSQVNTSEDTLRHLIRLWLFFVRPHDSVQAQVIGDLNKSNSNDGWFYLKRYDVGQLYHRQLSSIEQKKVVNFRTLSESILQLFKSQNNWTPNLQYFYTFCCFVYCIDIMRQNFGQSYDLSSSAKQYTSSTRIGGFGPRVFSSTAHKLEESLKKVVNKFQKQLPQIIVREKKRLPGFRFIQFWERFVQTRRVIFERIKSAYGIDLKYTELDVNELQGRFKNNSFEDEQTKYKRNSLVMYYLPVGRDPWDIPIADNQSKILYWILYLIAKGIYMASPRGMRGTYPLNLRTFANPLTTLMLIIICAMIYNYVL